MSHKQSLRDLQARLAERLQAAQSEVAPMAWLAVLVGDLPCLLPLSQAGEIFSLPAVARVPYTQAWFLGVASLRGSLVGVVDLAQFLATAPVRSEPAWAKARLVTLGADAGLNCALLVDDLLGLRQQDAFAHTAPAVAGSPAYLGQRLTDAQGAVWQEFDLVALSRTPAFLRVGA